MVARRLTMLTLCGACVVVGMLLGIPVFFMRRTIGHEVMR